MVAEQMAREEKQHGSEKGKETREVEELEESGEHDS
jgi:hypothetical protein